MSAAPAGWSDDGRELRRKYELRGFVEAVALVNKIAALAETADHHPDLHLTGYRRLEIVLSTHDAGNRVTQKDYELAARIEALPHEVR